MLAAASVSCTLILPAVVVEEGDRVAAPIGRKSRTMRERERESACCTLIHLTAAKSKSPLFPSYRRTIRVCVHSRSRRINSNTPVLLRVAEAKIVGVLL